MAFTLNFLVKFCFLRSNRLVLGLGMLLALLWPGTLLAATWYVNAERPDDDGDGMSWENAKQSIQTAIMVAEDDDLILVAKGTYSPIDTYGKVVTIRAESGAEMTVIDGGGIERCANLGGEGERNVILIGFTLQNGNANGNGGGAWGGILQQCVVQNNQAEINGGGAASSDIFDSLIVDNLSNEFGGGVYACDLYRCVVQDNQAEVAGGGVVSSNLYNCLVIGNETEYDGGGALYSFLLQCTMVENWAGGVGGGAYDCDFFNCIVWDNVAEDKHADEGASGEEEKLDISKIQNAHEGSFSHSCSDPLPDGVGNICEDPRFADSAGGNYRLLLQSPCIDTGDNTPGADDEGSSGYYIGDTDLIGNLRIYNDIVDMGAYEFQGLPSPIENLTMAPDTGVEGDFITKLEPDEQLRFSGIILQSLRRLAMKQGEETLAELDLQGDEQDFAFTVELAEGEHQLLLLAVDEDGYEHVRKLTVLIDNTTPVLVTLSMTPDTGTSGDFVTQLPDGDQLALQLQFTEDHLAIEIRENDLVLAQTPDTGSELAATLNFPLQEGNHELIIAYSDRAGNNASAGLSIVIDNTAPNPVTKLAMLPDTGALGDFITVLLDGELLTMTGQLPEQKLSVVIREQEEILASLDDSDDAHTFSLAFPLAEGQHELTVVVTDWAGNSTELTQVVIIDNTVPRFEVMAMTPDTGAVGDSITQLPDGETLTLRLALTEPSLEVSIFDGNETLAGVLDTGEQLECALSFALVEGVHELLIAATDLAGNRAYQDVIVTIDNTAPGQAEELSMTPDTGATGDFVTQLPAGEELTLSGKLPEKLLTVIISVSDRELARKTCDGDDQNFALSFPLPEGIHDLFVTVQDVAGNCAVANQTVVVDNTAPDVAGALSITPDYGQSNQDGITWLPEDESLQLHFIVQETPVRARLVCYFEGNPEPVCRETWEVTGVTGKMVTRDLDFRQAGKYQLQLTLCDTAGNESRMANMPVIIDAAPLTVTITEFPEKYGDGDSLMIGFSDGVSPEFSKDNLELFFNGVAQNDFELEVVDSRTYKLDKILPDRRQEGEFMLFVKLSELEKEVSGLPGQGEHEEKWQYQLEEFDYVWQKGWNTLFLPFEYLVPETETQLLNMPCFVMDTETYTQLEELPLRVAMWVFYDPSQKEPELRGVRVEQSAGVKPAIPIGKWSLIPWEQEAGKVPDGWHAWEWSGGKYELVDNFKYGQVYVVFSTR